MSYIKGGIVTRIDTSKNKEAALEFLEENFDLNLFTNNSDSYLLKEKKLQENLIKFRQEFLDFTMGKGDSLNSCEAYCLEVDVDKMLESGIYLTDDNTKFYFGIDKTKKFETDFCHYYKRKFSLSLFFIPVFWDVNWIEAEDFYIMSVTVNNLTRKAMKNPLKNASWVTII